MVTYMDQGMHHTVEAARLVGVDPQPSTPEVQRRPALLVLSLNGLNSFHFLISFHPIAEFSKRGVALHRTPNGTRKLNQSRTLRPTDKGLHPRRHHPHAQTPSRLPQARIRQHLR